MFHEICINYKRNNYALKCNKRDVKKEESFTIF